MDTVRQFIDVVRDRVTRLDAATHGGVGRILRSTGAAFANEIAESLVHQTADGGGGGGGGGDDDDDVGRTAAAAEPGPRPTGGWTLGEMVSDTRVWNERASVEVPVLVLLSV